MCVSQERCVCVSQECCVRVSQECCVCRRRAVWGSQEGCVCVCRSAETARLRRAEGPAELGRVRGGCFGMAAAKAGAGSCDADASEWQQPKRMPGVACVCCTLSRLSDACACRCRVECATCFRYILTHVFDEKSYMSRPSHHQPCVQSFSSRSVNSKSSRVLCHARCVASVMERRIDRERQTCSWSVIYIL